MNKFRDFIDQVRQQTDIVKVIGRYLSLDSHNMGLCPFHHDTNPSLSVNPQGQYFNCFGCHRGGDVFRFLELAKGMTFMESLEHLAKEAGLALPGMTEEDHQRMAADRLRLSILDETAHYHHQQLSAEARAYLKSRGFGDDLIRDFRLGFGDGTLAEHLIDGKKFSVESCIEAGVLVRDHADLLDYFAGRIVFPNIRRGQVVHLTGRVLGNEEPRHRHLKGEVRYLYNEDALRHETVVLTEGIPDCLSVIQAGHPAVAVLGIASFKPEYVARFAKCKTVYVAMDNDEKGPEAALKIGSMLGSKARIVALTEGKDLNEYFQSHTPEEFKILLAKAKDVIRHRICQIPQDTDKVELPTVLEPVLRDLAVMDGIRAEAYLGRDIKQRFELSAAEVTAYRKKVSESRKGLDNGEALDSDDGQSLQMCAKFDGLVDLVDDEGEVAFLIKQDGELKIVRRVEQGGKVLIPPRVDILRWLLPRAAEVLRYYGSPAMATDQFGRDLYRELEEYHRSCSELPAEDFYGLLACWDIHTYFQEHIRYTPILCLSGLHARGKTRTGCGIAHVAYRGFSELALREANVMRFADYLEATLFFDVRDLKKKIQNSDCEDMLLNRFEFKSQITRVKNPDRPALEDMVSYKVSSPTIVSTNGIIDDILESRCISINMRETNREFATDVDKEAGQPLREKLVAFRAKHMESGLVTVEGKPARSRLGDILKPLYQVMLMVNPEGKDRFLQLAVQLDKERKMALNNGPEAQLFNTVLLMEPRVTRGMLAVKDITDAVNADKQERFKLSAHRISNMLRAMGFSSGCMPNGNAGILWDSHIIDDLRQRYAV